MHYLLQPRIGRPAALRLNHQKADDESPHLRRRQRPSSSSSCFYYVRTTSTYPTVPVADPVSLIAQLASSHPTSLTPVRCVCACVSASKTAEHPPHLIPRARAQLRAQPRCCRQTSALAIDSPATSTMPATSSTDSLNEPQSENRIERRTSFQSPKADDELRFPLGCTQSPPEPAPTMPW